MFLITRPIAESNELIALLADKGIVATHLPLMSIVPCQKFSLGDIDAIKNAKDTASQFAQNSGSVVGSVARGNQGVFDITDKDPGSPEYKKIRLVSTLRFLLK